VLGSRDTRERLLGEAVAEMEAFQRKYAHLTEVSEVIEAMERARKRVQAKVSPETVGREARA